MGGIQLSSDPEGGGLDEVEVAGVVAGEQQAQRMQFSEQVGFEESM